MRTEKAIVKRYNSTREKLRELGEGEDHAILAEQMIGELDVLQWILGEKYFPKKEDLEE